VGFEVGLGVEVDDFARSEAVLDDSAIGSASDGLVFPSTTSASFSDGSSLDFSSASSFSFASLTHLLSFKRYGEVCSCLD